MPTKADDLERRIEQVELARAEPASPQEADGRAADEVAGADR